ncbi:MAG: UDP-3-O-(3-hydroxymyristoyl)glucosamine N-acyltransferase [Armatimonadota bacterium]|nr:UDP-3-O-(3-hydroxymyristoyl)glucosamine N-acyltransferase [Armatimonadota bacterium]MDR7422359.1 UDP-3-O-(3-hydroxymyristoyl)glucosamine N-acyltransferase [Armatimonadota bacterium]MDR7455600.1 UDP-3-O-(3-hydroxymyristoyl)glucosamine N-acyltransferase [Armatimonadota bacterium]
MKLADLAERAGAALAGPGDLEVVEITDLDRAHPRALVMVADARRLPAADASAAGALLVPVDAPPTTKPALRARHVRAAFARALAALAPDERPRPGVHPSAVVAPDARVGADASVGAHAVVGPAAEIGARAAIGAGAVVGARARVGADSVLHPRVVVYPDTVIGDRVILHSGAVIGADGFGYATEEGVHLKIPHRGRVVIEDDVEIGANTTVDRATLGETRIGRGTKIDNLVQIGHNVTIGPGVLIAAQTGISGSVTIGEGAVLAGQVGVRDHVAIGARAVVLGGAGITKTIPAGATVSGLPARDHREQLRREAAVARLPEVLAHLRALRRADVPGGGEGA